MNREEKRERPSAAQLAAEIERNESRTKFSQALRSTIYILITVAAIAVLISTLLFPVMKTYGSSMTPTIEDGEILVALKNSDFTTGDVIAFYYNNKILVKRVICGPGDWVDLREDGTVIVNGTALEEPYLKSKAYGTSDIGYPYQVPDGQYLVLGDHRETSVDSRNSVVGCVANEQIVGRILCCIWPLHDLRIL